MLNGDARYSHRTRESVRGGPGGVQNIVSHIRQLRADKKLNPKDKIATVIFWPICNRHKSITNLSAHPTSRLETTCIIDLEVNLSGIVNIMYLIFNNYAVT